MILVEECRLGLDDQVDEFLPELANRKVLRRLDAPLGRRRACKTRDHLARSSHLPLGIRRCYGVAASNQQESTM
jgi:hypothetical protein